MKSLQRTIPVILLLLLAGIAAAHAQQITNTPGTVWQQGFLMDNNNTLTTPDGVFHYNLYLTESYDGTKPFALHVALPGWEGLYFQGLG